MELYSTSPDVFEKKLKILDQQIEDDAIDLANRNIEKAKSKLETMTEDKMKQREKLVEQMAKIILEENEDYIGEDVAQEAIKELEKYVKEEEEKTKAEKTTKAKTTTKTRTTKKKGV